MLYIRVDANKTIAAGHVMRCLAIANSLRGFGEDSIFITSEKDAAKIISENKFQAILIDGRWDNLEYEISTIKSLIEQNSINKLLIDSYYITNKYLNNIPKEVSVIYLGSLLEKFERVNLLINYSSVYDESFYINNYCNRGVKALLGVKYAPLREEFQNLRPLSKNTVDSILLTTGSTDKNNVTFKILNYILEKEFFKNIQINVVIGRLNSNYNKINQLTSEYNNIVLYSDVKNMSSLMRENQIAISASGTTLYELCACGVPSVSFALVREQEKDGIKFDIDRIIAYAGSFADSDMTSMVLLNIKELLIQYILNQDLRNEVAVKMNQYIDGNGSIRIAEEIFCLDRSR